MSTNDDSGPPADYVIGCADHHQHAGDVLLQHGRYLFCG